MPGDTLVVHLDRVRTNRDSAYQTNLISSNALEAGYLRGLAKFDSASPHGRSMPRPVSPPSSIRTASWRL